MREKDRVLYRPLLEVSLLPPSFSSSFSPFRLLQYCVQEFQKQNGVDITKNAKALKRLGAKCTEAKHALSQVSECGRRSLCFLREIATALLVFVRALTTLRVFLVCTYACAAIFRLLQRRLKLMLCTRESILSLLSLGAYRRGISLLLLLISVCLLSSFFFPLFHFYSCLILLTLFSATLFLFSSTVPSAVRSLMSYATTFFSGVSSQYRRRWQTRNLQRKILMR